MKSSSKIFLFLLIFFSFITCNAQIDSASTDTSSNKKFRIRGPKEWSRPEKAGISSAIIPGLGQAYNKKYWKIPIVYGVGGFLVASAIYHHQEYKKVRDGLINNTWEDTSGTTFSYPITMRGQVFYLQESYEIDSENQYRTARDQQRGKRDLFIVYGVVLYAVNIIDAIVDAHLYEFDLGDDLSLEIKPNIYPTNNTFVAGLTLNFNLK